MVISSIISIQRAFSVIVVPRTGLGYNARNKAKIGVDPAREGGAV